MLSYLQSPPNVGLLKASRKNIPLSDVLQPGTMGGNSHLEFKVSGSLEGWGIQFAALEEGWYLGGGSLNPAHGALIFLPA